MLNNHNSLCSVVYNLRSIQKSDSNVHTSHWLLICPTGTFLSNVSYMNEFTLNLVWQTLTAVLNDKMNSPALANIFLSVQREVLGVFHQICVLHFEAALTNFAVESNLYDVSI